MSEAGTTITEPEPVGAEALWAAYGAGMVTFMVDIGHRTGLFKAAAQGAATSGELADRAGCVERYVREWLGALTAAGLFSYNGTSESYTLREEYVQCTTKERGERGRGGQGTRGGGAPGRGRRRVLSDRRRCA